MLREALGGLAGFSLSEGLVQPQTTRSLPTWSVESHGVTLLSLIMGMWEPGIFG